MPRLSLLGMAALSVLACSARSSVAGQPAPGDRMNFVACPVVRDTKTVPVWLVEYDGEWYYLGIQQDIGAEFHPPQLKHKVLVEGVVSDQPRICGGIPLGPLTISVLPEVDCNCNTILPAEEGMDAPPAPRPAGPSTRESRAARERPPRPERAAALLESAGPRTFEVPFGFDSDFMRGSITRIVDQAVRHAQSHPEAPIAIRGFRATTLLSNGEPFVENPYIAKTRAQTIEAIFLGLGIPRERIATTWQDEPEPGDGITDPKRRRVEIRIGE